MAFISNIDKWCDTVNKKNRQFKLNRFAKALGALVLSSPAIAMAASNSFVISDIRVEGLQRVDAGEVFSALPVNVGDAVDGPRIARVVKNLFKTGFFKDINIGRDGNILVINVEERPSINSIVIEGNEAVPSEDLLAGLGSSGLAEGKIFQRATLERIQLELSRQYVAQGRYSVEVNAEVEELSRNRVGVNINIDEGPVSGVKHINIVGNRVFEEEELLKGFELKLPNLLSFFTNDDRYSREKLRGDLERLESYYRDRGYLKFRILSTQVSITPDKTDVYVTINISEGEKYNIRGVELAGDLVIPESVLKQVILVREGQVFSQQFVTSTEELLTKTLGNSGYTFAEVQGAPEVFDEDNTVNIKFFVNPGKRAYVRRIDFKGNLTTEDEVLRREMRQMEGGWASNAKIELSKVRLQRLGFFKDVAVETVPVANSDDQVDVVYSVEEQSSGSISASFGFSQTSGLILGASFTQNNFLGTGNRVSLGVTNNDFQTSYNLSYVNPYYTVDGISRGISLFNRETNFDEINIARFSTNSAGGSVSFGYPLGETERLNFSFGAENTNIQEGVIPPLEISEFLRRNGSDYNLYKFSATYSKSTLNRGLLATAGSSQTLAIEAALPGSDLEFFKIRYRGEFFRPIAQDLNLRIRSEIAYGDGYGKTDRLPFFEHFFSGGFGSVRGFKENTLGPKSTPADGTGPSGLVDPDQEGDPFGGNILVQGSVELLFPLPFIEDKQQVQTGIFFDAGNIFDSNCDGRIVECEDFSFSDIRYAVGFGATIISPLGPVSVSIAKALNAKSEDDEEIFQFDLGRSF